MLLLRLLRMLHVGRNKLPTVRRKLLSNRRRLLLRQLRALLITALTRNKLLGAYDNRKP
jgi:hypothetical protein